MSWAEDTALRDPERCYADGFGDGLLLALALAKIDRGWAEGTLDELCAMHQRRVAEQLAGTPVEAPTLEQHRMLVFARAQEILRRSDAAGG
jgi:hypothetical protein